jgi:hypothetical protein
MYLNMQKQPDYLITGQIHYTSSPGVVEVLDLPDRSIMIYEISKDAIENNYNIHLLTLTAISHGVLELLKSDDTRILITVSEDGKTVSNKKFLVSSKEGINSWSVPDAEGIVNVQLPLISEEMYIFSHSNKYSSVSTLDSSVVSNPVTSHYLLSQMLQTISSDYGSTFDVNYNSAGEIKNLFESIRIPENLKNFQAFEYVLNEYPPYLLEPYLIFDDFNISEASNTDYTLHLFNLCDIAGNYPLKNIVNISGMNPNIGYVEFVGSTPFMDYLQVDAELKSTLMIKNENENKIYELKPLIPGQRSNEILQLTSTLGIDAFINKMYIKKRLAETKADIKVYKYDSLGLKDVVFGRVYNIDNLKDYNYFPVSIYYKFIRKNDDGFTMENTVEFLKIPGNLISSN